MQRHHLHSPTAAMILAALAVALPASPSHADFKNHNIVTDSAGLWIGSVELHNLHADTFTFPRSRFWSVEATMVSEDPFLQGSLFVKANHIHAPHPGETNPGPDLLASLDVTIVPRVWGPATDIEAHFAHPDTLTMQLDAREFDPGKTNAVLWIQLEHPHVTLPAPASLVCLGLAGLFAGGRRRPLNR